LPLSYTESSLLLLQDDEPNVYVRLGTARYTEPRVKTREQVKGANILHSTYGVLRHAVCLTCIALCSHVTSCSTALLEKLPVV
jgi:hypothetical protein